MGANIDNTRSTYFIFDFNDNNTDNLEGAIVIQFPKEWTNPGPRYSDNDEDITVS